MSILQFYGKEIEIIRKCITIITYLIEFYNMLYIRINCFVAFVVLHGIKQKHVVVISSDFLIRLRKTKNG